MSKKLLAIFISLLFLITIFSSNSFALQKDRVNKGDSKYDTIKVDINNQDSSIELSIVEAEQIKNKLLEIENKFIGAEKISEQLKIMHEIGVIPSNFSLEYLYSIKNKLSTLKDMPFFFPRPHLIIGGPMIVSHLTLGGRITAILPRKANYTVNFTYELEGFLNGSYFHQVVGILPLYFGFSFNPVFITVVGLQIIQSKKFLFFPFIELLIPCIGTSIAFYYKSQNPKKDALFEYNIDVCLAGFIGGL
jgi:hypothetical protein